MPATIVASSVHRDQCASICRPCQSLRRLQRFSLSLSTSSFTRVQRHDGWTNHLRVLYRRSCRGYNSEAQAMNVWIVWLIISVGACAGSALAVTVLLELGVMK